MRLTRAEARQRNREALIEAAVAEMAVKGYAAARLEDIAERAEVTTGAIYSIFGSKQGLLAATIEHLGLRIGAATADLESPELTLPEVLRGLAGLYFRTAVSDGAHRQMAFELEATGAALRDPAVGEILRAAVTDAVDQCFAGLLTDRRITAAPKASRTTAEQAHRLAVAATALLSGLAQRAVLAPGTVTEDEFVSAALALASLAH
ncbi:TetR/AcrR family transcriptional regulator [Nocardia crassostreae]|uniref:TetR/AcrR family transcriptional regulator n=1 Tax=Nocardia crassostreae TaxID=53428 RepID=UPI000835534A|nr:TetR/AcrR family transcriptional regulator [Nocardia crassostreae]